MGTEMHGVGNPKTWKTGGPSPELTANFFSYLTWQWVQPFINLGNKKTMQAEDLYDLNPKERTDHSEKQWNDSVEYQKRKSGKYNVWKIVLLVGGRDMFWSFFSCPIWLGSVVSQVYLIKYLLIVAEQTDKKLEWWRGLLLVSGMLFSSNVQSLALHFNYSTGQKAGMKIRSALSMAVFNKLLELRLVASGGTSSGQMLNLVTNDTQKLLDAASFLAFSSFSIVDSLVVGGLAIGEVGISSLPGLAVIIMAMFVQISMAQAVGRMRIRAVKLTDSRVRTIQEILSGVRVVKFNGWTNAFLERIQGIRKLEMHWIRKASFQRASTSTLKEGVAPLAALVTFGTYVGIHHGGFNASKVFTVLSLYAILSRVYGICPLGMQYAWESKIALRRLQTLLDLPNGRGRSSEESLEQIRKVYPDVAVAISEGTFTWFIKGQSNTEANSNIPGKDYVTKRRYATSRTMHIDSSPENQNGHDVQPSGLKEDLELGLGALKGISMAVFKGELVAIVGSVGSGKSSLLQAILGEMECVRGVCLMDKTVSYAPQQPWILNDTIKNNILFMSDYDEARYKQTLFACALDHDFKGLPAGDDTEIGERGVNLSGGQKARVSLARACYRSAEVVLLDDPLAAVDVPTARHLMEHVLTGILKGRTVILVTHNKTSLELCDRVFLMDNGTLQELNSKDDIMDDILVPEEENEDDVPEDEDDYGYSDDGIESEGDNPQEESQKDGKVEQQPAPLENVEVPKGPIHSASYRSGSYRSGSYRSASYKSASYKKSGSGRNMDFRARSVRKSFADAAEAAKVAAGTLTVKEDRVIGEVTWKTYLEYVKGSGLWLWVLVLSLFLFAQAVRVMVDYWLSIWVDRQYHLSTNMYLIVYAIWIGGMILFCFARGILFTDATIRAAKSMHSTMARSVLRSPQLFFDQNPVGRIVNRFGKDQSIVDDLLPRTALSMFENLVGVVGVMVIIAVIMPWFLLSLPPFVMILRYCQVRYVEISRELRRLDGLSRSPIYAHFSQTLQGVTSVRAYGTQVAMQNRFRECIDANNRAYILQIHTSRWLGIRLDFAAAICVTTAALLAILLRHSIGASLIGVVLVQGLQLTGLFQSGVRWAADTENLFTSVERTQAYTKLPSEASPTSPPGLITDEWPENGGIEFVNYTMAYREDLPAVLNNLTFKVYPRQKIGILGRTGAGKSSLAAALFRMVENSACSGSILIDNIDLKHVGLDDLRLRLSIIPQDPVLFRGTVRLNLDPFHHHSDIEIYEALEKVQLTSKINTLDSGLNSTVAENGDNFSVGQRQLLCLARSLLRKSRIIVMDEATAAVDGETDQLIQQTIRGVFQNCTVLTIAHRIDTIIDCDRVLVLARGGRVSEFDSPLNLLRHAEEVNLSDTTTTRTDHVFANMVAQAGPVIAAQLRKAAEDAEKKRLDRISERIQYSG